MPGDVPFSADIIGRLNCDAGVLENGGLRNGMYTALGFYVGHFEGPVAANYDRQTSAFSGGVWSVVEIGAAPGFGGAGTWEALWVGP
jgi:hypothetical protein